MFEHILQQMREKVRANQYVMTTHAEEEMADDDLSIFDVESAILIGEIIVRQKDIDQWKYVIQGQALSGDEIAVVGRISITGKLVIITVYRI